MGAFTTTRVSISWLYPCNTSPYIRFVNSQYHVDWLKCTEQNVNNQNLTQVSQLYIHVSFCVKVIRSWHNLPTGGHGHVICMLELGSVHTGAGKSDIHRYHYPVFDVNNSCALSLSNYAGVLWEMTIIIIICAPITSLTN